jgi:hypothetical protein
MRVTRAQVAEEQVRLLLHAGEMPPDAAPPAPAAEEEEPAPVTGAPAEAAPGAAAEGSGAEGAGDDAADATAASAAAEAGAGGADGDAAVAELAAAPLPEGYDTVGHRVAVFWSGDGTWCAPDAVAACLHMPHKLAHAHAMHPFPFCAPPPGRRGLWSGTTRAPGVTPCRTTPAARRSWSCVASACCCAASAAAAPPGWLPPLRARLCGAK